MANLALNDKIEIMKIIKNIYFVYKIPRYNI